MTTTSDSLIRPLARGLAITLFAALLLGGGVAAAQTSAPPQRVAPEKIETWERTLQRANLALRNPGITLQVLETWQIRVRDVLREARAAHEPAKARVARQKALIEALGPEPGKGQTEPKETADRRAELKKTLAAAEQRARILGLIVTRGEALRTRIADRRADVLTARLLASGPPLWSLDTWRAAAEDAGRVAGRLANAASEWVKSARVADWLASTGPLELALYLLLAAFILIWLRRWLDRVAGSLSRVEDPEQHQRLIGTLIILFNHGIAPAAVILSAYGVMAGEELLGGLFGETLQGLAFGLALFFFLRGGARAALAPRYAAWRVVGVTDHCARRVYALAQIIAGLLAVDQVLSPVLNGVFVSREFVAVIGLFINGGLGVALFLIGSKRLWKPAARGADEGLTPEHRLASVLRRLARFSGAVTLLAIVLAYNNLADFLAQNSALTAFILGGGWVLRHVLAALLDHVTISGAAPARLLRRRIGLTEDGAPVMRIWILLAVDLILIAIGILLLAIVWGTDALAAVETVRELWHGLKIGGVTISLRDLLIAILVFIALVIVVRSLQRQFEQRIGTQTEMDIGVRRALRAGIGYAGVIIAAAIGISLAGFDLSNLAIIAGALSVGIGFGLQAIVNNFVSGIILFVERPVKEGDWVVVDKYEGYIKRIGVRATEITTLQNAAVIMPNSKLITEPVQNWVHKDQTGRVDIDVGVAYGSDTELVHQVLVDCAKAHEAVLETPTPVALFMNFGDSSLDFQLRIYVRNIRDVYRISSDLRFAIDKAFRENGITIPFPQRDLHVKHWPAPPAEDGESSRKPDKA